VISRISRVEDAVSTGILKRKLSVTEWKRQHNPFKGKRSMVLHCLIQAELYLALTA
jgi:hypothetical protein